MKNKDCMKVLEACKQKCTCSKYNLPRGRQRRSEDINRFAEEQRTFISFATEVVSVVAFIFFGSLFFWLTVTGVVFNFLKRMYYFDRYMKLFTTGLLALLLLSIAFRFASNKRACRSQKALQQMDITAASMKDITPMPEPPQLTPDYMTVTLKDQNVQKTSTGEPNETNITRRLTLTIINENKQEIFKTSKVFFIPEMAMEMKKPPALIVYLKELVLDNY